MKRSNYELCAAILAKIGNNRKAYTIVCDASVKAEMNLRIPVTDLSLIDSFEKSVLHPSKPCIGFIADKGLGVLEPHELLLVDEIIVPANTPIDKYVVQPNQWQVQNYGGDDGVDIFTEKRLNMLDVICIDVNKHNIEMLNSLDNTVPWETYHIAHYWPQHGLLLQVIWDMREIVNVIPVDDDLVPIFKNMATANDNLKYYFTYEHFRKELKVLDEFILDYIEA